MECATSSMAGDVSAKRPMDARLFGPFSTVAMDVLCAVDVRALDASHAATVRVHQCSYKMIHIHQS
jgi:hypothetical protein